LGEKVKNKIDGYPAESASRVKRNREK